MDDETAGCGLCNSVFTDPLAWCAHRPWRNQYQRDKCRWPDALRKRSGIWTLKPSCRKAVEIAEDGPVAEFRIFWPTLTVDSKNGRNRGYGESMKMEPHRYAGFRAPYHA